MPSTSYIADPLSALSDPENNYFFFLAASQLAASPFSAVYIRNNTSYFSNQTLFHVEKCNLVDSCNV